MDREKIKEEIHKMLKEISDENRKIVYGFVKGIYAREMEAKTNCTK